MLLNFDKNLTAAEFGLISEMIVLPRADYNSLEYLSSLNKNSYDEIKETMENLIQKGYVHKVGCVYAVKKEIIPRLITH